MPSPSSGSIIADALPEQPHPVLLLRANDLVFRAFRRCPSCPSRPIPIALAGCAARSVPFEQADALAAQLRSSYWAKKS